MFSRFLSCSYRADPGSSALACQTPLLSVFRAGIGNAGDHSILRRIVHSQKNEAELRHARPLGNKRFPKKIPTGQCKINKPNLEICIS